MQAIFPRYRVCLFHAIRVAVALSMTWILLFVSTDLAAQLVDIPTVPIEPEKDKPGSDRGPIAAQSTVDANVSNSDHVASPIDRANTSADVPGLDVPSPLPRTVAPPAPPQRLRVPSDRPSLGAVSGAYSAAPNMIGDTTSGSCGVLRFDGGVPVVSVAHPTFACSRVNISENNSALIRDRLYASYRHFNAASNISVFPTSPNGGAAPLNIDRITLGAEKRIGYRSSLELRVPVNVQMSSDLFFSQRTALVPGGPPQVSIPLDDYETSFGNISLILKHNILRTRNSVFSGGIAADIPTAPDVQLKGIIDDENFEIKDPNGNLIATTNVQFSFDALIENELFTLSPFLAFVSSQNEKWFFQGFAQLDFPVTPLFGSVTANLNLPAVGIQLPEIRDAGDIRLQKLARLSIGAGRWIYRCDTARYLNAIAAVSELHYTTTIEDAPLAEVEIFPPIGPLVPATTVQIGNVANRTDVLDWVLGTHVRVAKTTFTTAVALPLRTGDDRGFEFELTFFVNRQL